AAYVQWRTKRTRQYALRKKSGVQLADTSEPVSVSCVNRDLAALRRVLNVARLWKVITEVPIIRLLPGEKNHERVLSHAEEDRYLEPKHHCSCGNSQRSCSTPACGRKRSAVCVGRT